MKEDNWKKKYFLSISVQVKVYTVDSYRENLTFKLTSSHFIASSVDSKVFLYYLYIFIHLNCTIIIC